MNLAISTSWNAYRHDRGEDLIFEIKQLGFEAVELSFNLDPGMVEGIAGSARKCNIRITSLHNFCPIPEGLERGRALPDHYSMASLDEEERLKAVKYSRRSIETAERLGAKAVVLHCGRVEVCDHTRELIDIYERGGRDSPEFSGLQSRMIEERARSSGKHINQALKSVKELNAYASAKGILLGIETRFYYREIPNIDEIGIILNGAGCSQLGYWHDTGHAQLMENLGFLKHADFLERYGSRLIGVHLHGISGCRDHLAPVRGGVDFPMLGTYLNKNTLEVIEAHHPASAEELVQSRILIGNIYGAK